MTAETIARIAHATLGPLGRAFPELVPFTSALAGELERLFPGLAVTAGPSEPPARG
jgi:hypothetical protein